MDEYFFGWEVNGYLKRGKIIYWEKGNMFGFFLKIDHLFVMTKLWISMLFLDLQLLNFFCKWSCGCPACLWEVQGFIDHDGVVNYIALIQSFTVSFLFFSVSVFFCFPRNSACLLNVVFCLSCSEMYFSNTISYNTCWAMQVMYFTYIHCKDLAHRASSTAGN